MASVAEAVAGAVAGNTGGEEVPLARSMGSFSSSALSLSWGTSVSSTKYHHQNHGHETVRDNTLTESIDNATLPKYGIK